MTDSGALKGKTGNAVALTINHRDIATVKHVKNEFEMLKSTYNQMIEGFKDTVEETDSTAIINEDRINEEQRKIDQLTKDKKTVDDGFKLTKQPMDKSEPWHMGHRPGYEFRKHQQSAARRQISRKQFLDEHNVPEHYRPELPTSNSCHAAEDLSDVYKGP